MKKFVSIVVILALVASTLFTVIALFLDTGDNQNTNNITSSGVTN